MSDQRAPERRNDGRAPRVAAGPVSPGFLENLLTELDQAGPPVSGRRGRGSRRGAAARKRPEVDERASGPRARASAAPPAPAQQHASPPSPPAAHDPDQEAPSVPPPLPVAAPSGGKPSTWTVTMTFTDLVPLPPKKPDQEPEPPAAADLPAARPGPEPEADEAPPEVLDEGTGSPRPVQRGRLRAAVPLRAPSRSGDVVLTGARAGIGLPPQRGQVVAAELAIAAFALSLAHGPVVRTAAAALLVVAVAASFGSVRGRRLTEVVADVLAWSGRRTLATGPLRRWLGTWPSGVFGTRPVTEPVTIAGTEGFDGGVMGVAQDDDGWSAAAEVCHKRLAGAASQVEQVERVEQVELSEVIRLLDERGGPEHGAHLVAHRRDTGPVQLWLAVRVRPDESPAGGLLRDHRGATVLLRHRLRRLAALVDSAGLQLVALAPDQLARAVRPYAAEAPDGSAAAVEAVRDVRVDGGVETTLSISGLDAAVPDAWAAFDAMLTSVPGPLWVGVLMGPAAAPGGTAPAPRVAVRVRRTDRTALDEACLMVGRSLPGVAGVHRLGFRQMPALAAGAPLGRSWR